MYRDQISSSIVCIAGGLILGVTAVVAWCFRKRFFGSVERAASSRDANKPFRRYALLGFAASCFGVIGMEVYPGIPSAAVQLVAIAGLRIIVPVGFSASVLAFALGRDLRVQIRAGLIHYVLALLGVMLGVQLMSSLVIDPIRHMEWQWQNSF